MKFLFNLTESSRSMLCLLILAIGVSFIPATLFSQVGINSAGNPPDPSAGLDVNFPDRGLLIPRLTATQRNAISNPSFGLMIMNTTTGCLNIWTGASWKQVCGDCDFTPPAAGNNGPICDGSTLNLTAASLPGATYTWSGPNGFTSNVQNPVLTNVTPSASGSYSVSATLNGCTAQSQSTVATVNLPPSVTNTTLSQTINSGQNTAAVSLTADINSATFSWTASAGPNIAGFVTPGSGNSLPAQTITNTGNSAGNVTFVITPSANGCPGTPVNYVVTVNPPPGSIGNPLTSTAQADGYSLPAGNYYFLFPGASGGVSQLYYQPSMTDGFGFVRVFSSPNGGPSTLNKVGLSYPWTKFLIQTSTASTRATAYFVSPRLFNIDGSTVTSTGGTHPGYRVFIGQAGGMGIYNTTQLPCSWGDSTGAVGSGYPPCGTWPDALNFGTGTNSANYNFISGTWETWIAN